MAAKTVQLDIVSAENSIYHGQVSFFEVTGAEGELGIMPNHVALLTKIKPGMARFIKQDGSEEVLYLSGGLLEVQPTAISVLADVALRADDIDEKAALEAKERAEQAIANAGVDFNYEAAAIELAKSLAQLRVVECIKKNITR
ncbi:F0F1 ATP synthase subunit epsilon [Shewanella sp. SR43-4]|jgi:F-type H+-transporting ATPase subunit epsilon|uniref:ATP synthase epsilon chain n=1 Tax=Shewanella vesiculosa TaxID=518738 RepID=A0ABV0FTG5_9GAMM|nr:MULTISPECIES: F0F1 ATP synthase subunit epsilon [Shewanella]NCQ47119.1 F0F1 ATP synthase subunit epsilon [Shewanella frigidimarina]MBB1319505.1 F0F1 ATP synthase subunit epsilon [Shewanella sp. SR43-4]MBB1323536.1 F0F1 ATP synthase subunit epsilon [Shewanella sp. SR43-8]MBB1388824.1 F0F1 ATP synthase subunit epsilon [Shewanella sp. SG44-6]MBB1477654.1 F0F1 ATP synthase subunit epsilon [Shewanella sp. SG41-3]|tara:strand:- start:1040 stop:1468 length:429 start_codon:yes stop_codon:yes gene_type:complete